MAAPATSFETVVRRITIITPITYAATPIVVAWIAGLVTDFGRSVKPEFFSVMAEGVLPVLLVAAVVEWGQLARSYLEMRPTDVVKFKMRSFSTGYGLLFAVGEGIALYAVAAGERTTFLALSVALSGALLLFDLIVNVRLRLGGDLESRLPENRIAAYAKRTATELERRAKRHEAEADRLRSAADEFDQPNGAPESRAK